MAGDPVARAPVPRGHGTASRREAGELDGHDSVQVPRRVNGGGHDVAARARDRLGDRGVLVGWMGGGARPGAAPRTVTGSTRAIAVPELHSTIEMQRPRRESGAVRVGLGMAIRA